MAAAGDIVHATGSRPYELLAPIGTGGMAEVFLGRAVGAGGFERLVAVKVCHAHLAKDAAFRAMFLDEARLAAHVRHPNVVSTLDVGEGEHLFLVMDYVEGANLADLEARVAAGGGAVPLPVALRIVTDALVGLEAAHGAKGPGGESLGLIHRDAGAHNILVGVDGIARIADFGIAKAAARSAGTKEGHVKGRLGYMPPEYLHDRTVGRFTDVYGMGVALWEALLGEPLFTGETEGQILTAVMRGDVPTPSGRRPAVPAALDAVILRALDRDPVERFQTAGEFAVALGNVGVPLASATEVGNWVSAQVADALEAHRAAVRRSRRAVADVTPSSGVDGADHGPGSAGGFDTEVRVPTRGRPWVHGVWIVLALAALASLWAVVNGPGSPRPGEADVSEAAAGPVAPTDETGAPLQMQVGDAMVHAIGLGADGGSSGPTDGGLAQGESAREGQAQTGKNAVRSRTTRGAPGKKKPRLGKPTKKKEWQPQDI